MCVLMVQNREGRAYMEPRSAVFLAMWRDGQNIETARRGWLE